MNRELSLGDEISRVERRIEARRERATRHYELAKSEIKERVAKVASWWPLAAVVGSLAVGIAAARMPRRRPVNASLRAEPARPAAARGILASILAVAATAMRIAGSHQARTLWNAFRAYRARHQARG